MDSGMFRHLPIWPWVVGLILFGLACVGLWELAWWVWAHVSLSWK